MTLDELGIKYSTDKASKYPLFAQPGWGGVGHCYCDIYQRWFDPHWKDNAEKLLELGVLDGPSVRMWLEYFPTTHIYGFDHDVKRTAHLEGPRMTLIQGLQQIRDHLEILRQFAPYDIIIDDCSHSFEGQQTSLGYLFPMVKPGGLYIIEDLFTSHYGMHKDGAELPGMTTLRLMRLLQNNNMSRSKFMTDAEMAYVNAQTRSVTIEVGNRSEIAFIERRKI